MEADRVLVPPLIPLLRVEVPVLLTTADRVLVPPMLPLLRVEVPRDEAPINVLLYVREVEAIVALLPTRVEATAPVPRVVTATRCERCQSRALLIPPLLRVVAEVVRVVAPIRELNDRSERVDA